jgi:hypothetical protein
MFDNSYNRKVCSDISDITKRMIAHENNVNSDGKHEHKITTRLEGMALRKKNVKGGSGFAAATLGDHGFKADATLGAGTTAGAVETGCGVTAAGMSAAGVTAGGKPRKPRAKKITGGDLSLLHFDELKGQPKLTAPAQKKITVRTSSGVEQSKPVTKQDMPSAFQGSGKPKRVANARNLLVRKVMAEHHLSLPMASKYIKEHSLS